MNKKIRGLLQVEVMEGMKRHFNFYISDIREDLTDDEKFENRFTIKIKKIII